MRQRVIGKQYVGMWSDRRSVHHFHRLLPYATSSFLDVSVENPYGFTHPHFVRFADAGKDPRTVF